MVGPIWASSTAPRPLPLVHSTTPPPVPSLMIKPSIASLSQSPTSFSPTIVALTHSLTALVCSFEVRTRLSHIMSHPTVADAKAYLSQVDGGGNSVYDHVTTVLYNLLEQRPEDPLAVIDMVSSEAARERFTLPHPVEDAVVPLPSADTLDTLEMTQTQAKMFLVRPTPPYLFATHTPHTLQHSTQHHTLHNNNNQTKKRNRQNFLIF